jgi:4'-phosphopantetheinyl transferase
MARGDSLHRARDSRTAAEDLATNVWERPCGYYELPNDEVHVWRATLDYPRDRIAQLRQILSSEERDRADRFHFEADRTRHIVGRGLLRMLIGHCLDIPADQLHFEQGIFGKPRLNLGLSNRLEFNLSHSGKLVLIALCRERAVGVDVAQMRRGMATDAIATRFFSPNERRDLAKVAGDARCAAFFECWTRKEAYVKARGDGLSLRLDEFDVSFLPGEEPRLLETRHDPADARRWTLHALDPGLDYKAAIAVEGADWQLRCWQWPAGGADGALPEGPAQPALTRYPNQNDARLSVRSRNG